MNKMKDEQISFEKLLSSLNWIYDTSINKIIITKKTEVNIRWKEEKMYH